MLVKRVRPAAAVFAKGVCAGIIDSRNGSASVTPAPRRNVRRERCFLVMKLMGATIHQLHADTFTAGIEDVNELEGESKVPSSKSGGPRMGRGLITYKALNVSIRMHPN